MKQISSEIEVFVENFEGKVGFNSAELIKQDMESMKIQFMQWELLLVVLLEFQVLSIF